MGKADCADNHETLSFKWSGNVGYEGPGICWELGKNQFIIGIKLSIPLSLCTGHWNSNFSGKGMDDKYLTKQCHSFRLCSVSYVGIFPGRMEAGGNTQQKVNQPQDISTELFSQSSTNLPYSTGYSHYTYSYHIIR